MVRKGIPVAYRASIWPKISLSSVYRLQFPADYYQTLLVRSEGELAEKVKIDIEKDIDRYVPRTHATFFSDFSFSLLFFELPHPVFTFVASFLFLVLCPLSFFVSLPRLEHFPNTIISILLLVLKEKNPYEEFFMPLLFIIHLLVIANL